MPTNEIVVTLAANPASGPPTMATAVATSIVNELVVLSFAYYDPLTLQSSDAGRATATAKVFSQVGIPRSVCAQWLEQTLSVIKGMPDRETLGWSRLVQVFSRQE